jgi:hypothetical protein
VLASMSLRNRPHKEDYQDTNMLSTLVLRQN